MDKSRVFEVHATPPSLIRLTGQLSNGDMYTVEISIRPGGIIDAELRNARGVNAFASVISNEGLTAMLRATLSIPAATSRMYHLLGDSAAEPADPMEADGAAARATKRKRGGDGDEGDV
jgi:hypothetical protein